jgi:hypothetical protein
LALDNGDLSSKLRRLGLRLVWPDAGDDGLRQFDACG